MYVAFLHETIPFCATLETYDKTPIFIPIDITEDAFKLVAQKTFGGVRPGRYRLGSSTGVGFKIWIG